MADESSIREYIAEQIGTIKDIGRVYDTDLVPILGEEFDTQFEYDGRIQGWVVRWSGIGRCDPSSNFMNYPEEYTITTFYGYNYSDRTDIPFGQHVKAVFAMLTKDRTLGGHVANIVSVRVPDITLVKVSGVYSHFAEVILETNTFEL